MGQDHQDQSMTLYFNRDHSIFNTAESNYLTVFPDTNEVQLHTLPQPIDLSKTAYL